MAFCEKKEDKLYIWSVHQTVGFLPPFTVNNIHLSPDFGVTLGFKKSSFRFKIYPFVTDAAKVMWFERIFVFLCFVERNVVYPLVFLCGLTTSAQRLADEFSPM